MKSTQKGDRLPLERRVCRAIALLAAGWKVEEVAQAVQVRPATVEAWMSDEDFGVLLQCLNDWTHMKDQLARLNLLMPEAIEALRRAMQRQKYGAVLSEPQSISWIA